MVSVWAEMFAVGIKVKSQSVIKIEEILWEYEFSWAKFIQAQECLEM